VIGYSGRLGTDQRRAGSLPASICRQDGGAPVLPNLPDCSAPTSSFRLGRRNPGARDGKTLKRAEPLPLTEARHVFRSHKKSCESCTIGVRRGVAMRVLGTGHRCAGFLPASICRQDGGAPREPGERGQRARIGAFCNALPAGGCRKRGTACRVPMIPFHLILLVRPHLLHPTSRCRIWVARNRDRDRDRDRNRNFDCDPDFDPDLGFYDTLSGRGAVAIPSQGKGVQLVAYPTHCY